MWEMGPTQPNISIRRQQVYDNYCPVVAAAAVADA